MPIQKRLKVLATDYCAPFIHPAAYAFAASNLLKPIIGMNSGMTFRNYGLEAQWCVDLDNYAACGNAVLDKLSNVDFFETVKQNSSDGAKALSKYALSLYKENYTELTNEQLSARYEELFSIWVNLNIWGDIINASDFEHFALSNKIMSFLKNKVKGTSVPEAFAILLTPNKRSTLQQQDVDLFALLSSYKKNPNSKALEKHVDKYRWMQFHYDGPIVLDLTYFIQLLDAMSAQGVSGEEKIAEIQAHEKDIKSKQKTLSIQFNLSADELYWLEVGKEFAYLKALRKETVFEACCNSFPLIQEIAKRLKLSTMQVKFMTVKEVSHALQTGEVDVDEINRRTKHCVITTFPELKFHTGLDAEKIDAIIYEEKPAVDTVEVKGTVAFPGKVSGAAKIILVATDMKKFKQGDILVSPATNPNLLSIMKIAGAIVTDEGGVTCHAAIVSRELKIPCVIGTKVATKWLKDGDRVEVDAIKGVVTKL